MPGKLVDYIQDLEVALKHQVDVSETIHLVLSNVWLSKWHKMADNTIPCPTERLLAILTLNKDGTHKQPHEITQYFAKFEYCICLTCLKEIKLLAARKYDNNEEQACKYLSDWFTENTNYPFARIQSLQHLASAIAYQTKSLPRIWWIDTEHWQELLYQGNHIRLDSLQQMFAAHGQTTTEI